MNEKENNCIFCKIVEGKIPSRKIFENKTVLAFMDASPVNPGHILIIPKNHSENILSMHLSDWMEVQQIVHILAPKVKSAVDACGINVSMNNGKCSGQVIMHPHIHLIPRFENDGHNQWLSSKHTDQQIEEIYQDILKKM